MFFQFIALACVVAISCAGAAQEPANPRLDADGKPLPEGAVARIGSAKFRSGGQLSPDGKLVVSGYTTLAIRETDTDKKLVEFLYSKENGARMFAFATDNRRLATCDGYAKLSVYDARSGKPIWSSDNQKLKDPTRSRYIRAMKFVDGDKMIALACSPSELASGTGELYPHKQSGGYGWQVVLVDAEKGETLPSHQLDDAKKAALKELGDGYAMVHVAFSPTGERMAWLASPAKPEADGKSAVFVYETVSGKLLHALKDLPKTYRVDLPDEAEHIVWFPLRPEKIGSGVAVPGSVRSVPSGNERFRFDYRFEPRAYTSIWDSVAAHAVPVRSAVRMGDSLVAFDGFGATRWDWATGKKLDERPLPVNPYFVEVGFSTDRKRLMITEGGNGRLTDGEVALPKDRVWFPHSPIVRFLPDGKLRLTTAPEQDIAYGRRVDVWDPKTRTIVESKRYPAFAGLSRYGYMDADGKVRVGQDWESGETFVRDVTINKRLCQLEGVKRNNSMHHIWYEMSPDGSRVLTYSVEPDSTKRTSLLVRWFDSHTGKELGRLDIPARDADTHAGTPARWFSADGSVFGYCAPDQRLVLVDCATRKPVAALGVPRVYRPGARYTTSTFTFLRDAGFVLERVETYEPDMIAAKLVAREFTIWDREGHALRRFSRTIEFIPWALSTDGRTFAHFEKSKPVELYETATGKLRDTLTFPAGIEVSWPHPADLEPWTYFSPDGKLFATPVGGTVLVWDVDKLRTSKALPAPKHAKEAEPLWDNLGDADPAAAEPALRALIAAPKKALEVLKDRVKPANAVPAPVQQVRALEVLERIGTPEAKKIVETVAGGRADAVLTREAKLVLSRWR
jgi:WD40 repeat protein